MTKQGLLREAKLAKGEILVALSEVTRMSPGTFCVAGINVETEAMIRPLQSDGSNWVKPNFINPGRQNRPGRPFKSHQLRNHRPGLHSIGEQFAKEEKQNEANAIFEMERERYGRR